MVVIGLMSGTSADGIEAAVVEFGGSGQPVRWRLLHHLHVPFETALQAEILACMRPETGSVERVCALNVRLGEAFGQAALAAMRAARLRASEVSLIGSHGQTVWHAPERASTLQLGEPAVIAERTGCAVVSNFRARDLALGGQGAPLVSLLDQRLFAHPHETRAVQNIGGIGNVTYLSPTGDPIAFDTGPGNVLIDECVRLATAGAAGYDQDGQRAARGQVDQALLAEWLAHPYFRQAPPKTTGRELFGADRAAAVWAEARQRGLSADDLLATVTALTARSIAAAYRAWLPRAPERVIVSGGGAHNPTLMGMLAAELAPAVVVTSEALGLPGDAKEAIAFALLAYETWHGRPGNVPSATGATRAEVLGSLTPAPRRPAGPVVNRYPGADPSRLTEARNPLSADIDSLNTLALLQLINEEDQGVAWVVREALGALATAVDAVSERMRRGGRLVYMGSGTSGRLGVLDAAECTPTFSTAPGQVLGLIAGGSRALTEAVEGAEDDEVAALNDLIAIDLGAGDSFVGLAASGRTPYVLAALREARRRGALTISIACNHPSPIAELADIAIALPVGPEVITGSTRMKAGTAQKLALNMLSTGVMIRLGKTYGNLMVDVQPTNAKLRDRARRIVADATRLTLTEAADLLEQAQGEVKTAIVAHLAKVDISSARQYLVESDGIVRAALSSAARTPNDARPDPSAPSHPRARSERVFVGVDGGGSTTTALVIDAKGQVLGRGETGSSNANVIKPEEATRQVQDAISRALQAAGVAAGSIAGLCLGLAGIDRPDTRATWQAWCRATWPDRPLHLMTDADLVLAAHVGPGLAVVAGTGAIALGRDDAGRLHRASGWGPLLGDEGSAYWIGLQALQAVVQAADQRGPATVLTERILAHWALTAVPELIDVVHRRPASRAEVAALAVLVNQAADHDPLAAHILAQAGRHLATALTAVARSAGLFPTAPCAFAGGVLVHNPRVRAALIAACAADGLALDPIVSVSEPALLAARLALQA